MGGGILGVEHLGIGFLLGTELRKHPPLFLPSLSNSHFFLLLGIPPLLIIPSFPHLSLQHNLESRS